MRIVNVRGGKTLGKLIGKDPLSGQMLQVMLVRGSDGDIGSLSSDIAAIFYRVLHGKAVSAHRRSN